MEPYYMCDKMCAIGEYWDIKNFACKDKERVIDNLVLTCEDDILNITDITLINFPDKKVTWKHFIILVVVYLLLLVFISFNCYYCLTKHWLKNKPILLNHYYQKWSLEKFRVLLLWWLHY